MKGNDCSGEGLVHLLNEEFETRTSRCTGSLLFRSTQDLFGGTSEGSKAKIHAVGYQQREIIAWIGMLWRRCCMSRLPSATKSHHRRQAPAPPSGT